MRKAFHHKIASHVVTVSIVILLVVILLFDWGNDDQPEPTIDKARSTIDLGITYLPLTMKLSSYYDLEIGSGVLITAVTPKGIAGMAGVKAGDVIISFNGALVGKDSSILGMIRSCRIGTRVYIEIWRDGDIVPVEFWHRQSATAED